MHEWQVWLVAALLLFVAEMVAPGFWLLSVAVGCLAAGVASLVAPGALIPALTFAAGTLLSLVGIRPFLLRTDTNEGEEGPRGERESRDEGPRRHQGGDARGEAADRDR